MICNPFKLTVQINLCCKLFFPFSNNFLQLFNSERSRWESKLNSCEQDYKRKLVILEEQLTKQRERALALVNEKEQEIMSLKASFQALIPTPRVRLQSQTSENVSKTA